MTCLHFVNLLRGHSPRDEEPPSGGWFLRRRTAASSPTRDTSMVAGVDRFTITAAGWLGNASAGDEHEEDEDVHEALATRRRCSWRRRNCGEHQTTLLTFPPAKRCSDCERVTKQFVDGYSDGEHFIWVDAFAFFRFSLRVHTCVVFRVIARSVAYRSPLAVRHHRRLFAATDPRPSSPRVTIFVLLLHQANVQSLAVRVCGLCRFRRLTGRRTGSGALTQVAARHESQDDGRRPSRERLTMTPSLAARRHRHCCRAMPQ